MILKKGIKSDAKISSFRSNSPATLVINEHKKHFKKGLSNLANNPFANAMTIIVIAIAITLPACLYLLIQNGKSLSSQWESSHNINVYVSNTLDQTELAKLQARIKNNTNVASIKIIDADKAIQELGDSSELDLLSEALSTNPLPHTLVISPKQTDEQSLATVTESLQSLPNIESIQHDGEWLAKLMNIMSFLTRLAWFLGLLLGLGVLIVVYNTIRLHIDNRRDEIEVKKLIGASDSFVRRPFLYTGFWYGLLGAIIALVFISIMQILSKGPLDRLLEAYASNQQLTYFGFIESIILLLAGALLALLGAWIAANSRIRDIEPQ